MHLIVGLSGTMGTQALPTLFVCRGQRDGTQLKVERLILRNVVPRGQMQPRSVRLPLMHIMREGETEPGRTVLAPG